MRLMHGRALQTSDLSTPIQPSTGKAGVTQRKQNRPGIASNDNTMHVPTARSSTDLMKPNHTPTRHTRAKDKNKKKQKKTDRTSHQTQAGIGHSAPAHRGGHMQNRISRRQDNPTNGHTPSRIKSTHTRLTYTGTRPHAPGQQAGDHPVPAHIERPRPRHGGLPRTRTGNCSPLRPLGP